MKNNISITQFVPRPYISRLGKDWLERITFIRACKQGDEELITALLISIKPKIETKEEAATKNCSSGLVNASLKGYLPIMEKIFEFISDFESLRNMCNISVRYCNKAVINYLNPKIAFKIGRQREELSNFNYNYQKLETMYRFGQSIGSFMKISQHPFEKFSKISHLPAEIIDLILTNIGGTFKTVLSNRDVMMLYKIFQAPAEERVFSGYEFKNGEKKIIRGQMSFRQRLIEEERKYIDTGLAN